MPQDSDPSYPASFTNSNMVSVAAITATNVLASFSNFGAKGVDLGAPGDSILSTYPTSTFKVLSGTSMATPYVAATAAILRQQNPDLTYGKLRSAIRDHVTANPALAGRTVTGGPARRRRGAGIGRLSAALGMRSIATVLAIAVAAVVLGCGDDTVDAGKVEEEIQQDLSSATAQIVSVSCPEDVKKEEGKTFTCDAKLEGGGKAKVTVTQTDNRGNGTYSFKPGTLQLSDNAVEPVLEESLAAKGVSDPQVDCPDLIPVKEGETVTCTATGAGGRSGDVTFTWSSDDGSIDSSSVEAPEP